MVPGQDSSSEGEKKVKVERAHVGIDQKILNRRYVQLNALAVSGTSPPYVRCNPIAYSYTYIK